MARATQSSLSSVKTGDGRGGSSSGLGRPICEPHFAGRVRSVTTPVRRGPPQRPPWSVQVRNFPAMEMACVPWLYVAILNKGELNAEIIGHRDHWDVCLLDQRWRGKRPREKYQRRLCQVPRQYLRPKRGAARQEYQLLQGIELQERRFQVNSEWVGRPPQLAASFIARKFSPGRCWRISWL